MATIYISIGSNQDAENQIRYGIKRLQEKFSKLQLSSVYESEAVGFDGDNFLNLVAKANTQLTISQVDQAFKRIEASAGRRRDVPKFSDRTLDIDLLLYDDLVCEKPVQLPRFEVNKHAFVLLPLAEIAPELRHPVSQKNYLELWQAFDKKEQQKLWPIEFDWQSLI
ncbi:2-amino-4-hydroxy-6-hydroxymethyldihydropteridine diphosphokinase [Kangiella sp. HZ709]|uniref:2-amino-4-hydroxy-6- hydroxymethyldihydropteridine diphosphokinase n=1 Tax=Kangiella sp. HZ709 TaxID=2666328 RepID=UPI0012B03078|nr:2-amino-4-hydroxy-6-hydroxymethyldihydropteridine diphosphokinase [Kangiella sp. HZ709]MRX28659.1 2-amino-4-hydroxy-6-hydroxymethyldihydropteridine diphosphokinase [Kangiella sp. HZ709]